MTTNYPSYRYLESPLNLTVGQKKPASRNLVGFVPTSLSAVSEAPTSEELGVETQCPGRFRYSDLKEAAPGTMGFVSGYASLDRLRVCRCCQSAGVSLAGGRENGRGAVHRRVPSAQPYCVLRNARHRSSVRAEARARFEAGDVDSCGASAEMRRRSEEKLRGGEALDNLHGSAAKRTLPQRVNGQRRRGGARCWRMGLLE
jgi:hypothetical protein